MADNDRNFGVPADLPSVLPVLPIKQGFLLPGVISPFAVGRVTRLIAALDAAHDGWLIVALSSVSPFSLPSPVGPVFPSGFCPGL